MNAKSHADPIPADDPEDLPRTAKANFYRENARIMTEMAAATPLPALSDKYAAAATQWAALAQAQDRLIKRAG